MTCYSLNSICLALSFLLLAAFSQPALGQDQDADKELVRKSSMIIGYNMAKNMANQGIEIDTAALMEGIQKGFEGAEFAMDEEEVEATMMAFQKLMEKKQIEKMKQSAQLNQGEGEAYLAKFAAKEGVKKLENGVQYEVMNAGTGEQPKAENTVSIHYHGTLPDGKVFDSSVKRGQPAEFPVNAVVPGFSAALQAMKVGDKWRVVIPSDLAYGAQGPPGIGPNRVLTFEIELLQIVK